MDATNMLKSNSSKLTQFSEYKAAGALKVAALGYTTGH